MIVNVGGKDKISFKDIKLKGLFVKFEGRLKDPLIIDPAYTVNPQEPTVIANSNVVIDLVLNPDYDPNDNTTWTVTEGPDNNCFSYIPNPALPAENFTRSSSTINDAIDWSIVSINYNDPAFDINNCFFDYLRDVWFYNYLGVLQDEPGIIVDNPNYDPPYIYERNMTSITNLPFEVPVYIVLNRNGKDHILFEAFLSDFMAVKKVLEDEYNGVINPKYLHSFPPSGNIDSQVYYYLDFRKTYSISGNDRLNLYVDFSRSTEYLQSGSYLSIHEDRSIDLPDGSIIGFQKIEPDPLERIFNIDVKCSCLRFYDVLKGRSIESLHIVSGSYDLTFNKDQLVNRNCGFELRNLFESPIDVSVRVECTLVEGFNRGDVIFYAIKRL